MSLQNDLSSVHLLISELGALLGVPDLALDESLVCCLGLDDLVVNLEVNEKDATLLLYSVVASLPDTGREPLLMTALSANLLWGETAGDTLALAESSAAILLQRQMRLESLDIQSLAAGLEHFANQCEHWIATLGEPTAAAPSASPAGIALHDFA